MDKEQTSPERRRELPRHTLHLVTGAEKILGMRELLIEFSLRCEQAGTMEDLHFFLTKPGLLKRVPKLLLVVRHGCTVDGALHAGDLLGVVLVYEFAMFGVQALATNDRSGRGTLLALPADRVMVAQIATRALLEGGAQLVLLSFQTGIEEGQDDGGFNDLGECAVKIKWKHRERMIDGYLPLEPTYEGTLATLGQKTRSHMRYYRRRAETQLEGRFEPELAMSRDEFMAFNRLSMYSVPDKVARWRYESQTMLTEPVLFGVRDGKGEWLSVVGGRRFEDRTEVLWQMNRDGYPTHSLATVMRSYYLEHEIGQGKRRFYIEGGTKHSIHHAFVKERLIDLVAMRQSRASQLLERLAIRLVPPDNELAHMVRSEDPGWLHN